MTDPRCESVQVEMSSAHDEGREVAPWAREHMDGCDECVEFAASLGALDLAMAARRFDLAPDVAESVVARVTRRHGAWWAVAAVALVGLTVGVVIGIMSSRVDVGLASELHELLFETGSGVDGLEADLVVVERGAHPDVPERVYEGTIDYVAPERLAIDLLDTTAYPSAAWPHNDLHLTIFDGDIVITAGTPCPVAAQPACLAAPMTAAVTNEPPFVEGVIRPLEIVGPGRSVSLPNDLSIVGTPTLAGRATVQVETTVAGVPLLSALTDRGSWRELHPTDPVIMWLDTATLVPLRIEVFAADSPERELWQIRRGYADQLGSDIPIFIVSLDDLVVGSGNVEPAQVDDAREGGFVDGPADIPSVVLPDGFEAHRSGHWLLPNGERVEVASWSDGRTWLKLEVTGGWDQPRLFGMPSRFVDQTEVPGGIAYFSPTGDSMAIHGHDRDVLLSGSVPPEVLVEVAGSLGVAGAPVPSGWVETAVRPVDDVPSGALVPGLEGWSALARVDEGSMEMLLTGGGDRSVLIRQAEDPTISLPVGPDVSVVEVRGHSGRFDGPTGTLTWVEDGTAIEMQSETVALSELLALADSMTAR